MSKFELRYFEDPHYPPGLKGGDEVKGYGYYPEYFPIVQAQLATLAELTGAHSLLDAGCGKGALAEYARRSLHLEVVGADFSDYATRQAHRRQGGENTVRTDVGRLPFSDASFNLCWCNGVLQYLEREQAQRALLEIARVSRTAAFVSNIAARQQYTDWGRHDELTRLYLRPQQWVSWARALGLEAIALPFEGESAILMTPQRSSLALRFVELSLERTHKLGALYRQPPGLAAFRRLWK